VDDTGAVTVENAACATGGAAALTFKTVPVTIDVNGFGGKWSGPDDNGYMSGSRTLYVVPGVYSYYGLVLQHDNPGSALRLYVGDGGEITVDNSDALTVSGNTVTFNNATVLIDPKDYKYHYQLDFLAEGYYNGPNVFTLPVGLTHRLLVGNKSSILFTFHADGSVTSLKLESAVGGQNLLTLKNTPFHFDTRLFEGQWYIGQYAENLWWETGSSDHMMVPGVQYSIRVMGKNYIRFGLDADGNILDMDKPESAETLGNTLTLKNTPLTIDPNGMDPAYVIGRVDLTSWVYEPKSYVMVPGMTYEYRVQGNRLWYLFSIAADSSVTMAEEQAAETAPGSIRFNTVDVTIEPTNYPDRWYISSLSAALTGMQSFTLAPGLEYSVKLPDRANISGDFLVREACYSQVDVLDIEGNLFDVTTACNQVSDADEDGVEDDIDNCVMVANPDQADFDLDGKGDVCDEDMDADSVLNDDDACQSTPLGSLVTSNGCSAFQFVDLMCDSQAFDNHGQFVSCVAHSANQLADEAVIVENEKKEFIKTASQAK